MCELLKKIYDEVLVYEKDIVNRNKNVDKKLISYYNIVNQLCRIH